MERNVLCVKWGDRYTAEHVNRLYKMVKRNMSLPFSFYCLTEDSTDINPEVNIIDLDLSLDLKKWWWKVCLFQDNLVSGDVNLYLDLDVVIQQSIDHMFYDTPQVGIIDRSYVTNSFFCNREHDDDFLSSSRTYYNSSILSWRNNSQQHIYDTFIKDKEWFTYFYRGLDGFLFNEIDPKHFIPINEDDFYFRRSQILMDGTDPNVRAHLIENRKDITQHIWFYERPICIITGDHYETFVKGLEKYFL